MTVKYINGQLVHPHECMSNELRASRYRHLKEKLALGNTTFYKNYPIHHKGKREYTVSFAANGLNEAKQLIEQMIQRGCLKP